MDTPGYVPRDDSRLGHDDDDDNNAFENNNLLVTIWIFSLVMFICLPFCASKYRRKLCLERIKQRRWDIPIEEVFEAHPPEWYRLALERYEALRAAQLAAEELEERNRRNALTEEQEDQVRQLYLSENMANFTTTVREANFQKQKEDNHSDNDDKLPSMTSSSSSSTSSSSSSTDLKDQDGDNGGAITDLETGVIATTTTATKDADDTDDDNNYMPLQEYHETDTYIRIPKAGTPKTDNNNTNCEGSSSTRLVPNGCAICLSEMESNESVTWASNSECKHVYHEECILNWLLAVGRKKRRRNDNNDHDNNGGGGPIRQAISFPKNCPTCRRPFIHTDLTDTLPSLATLREAAAATTTSISMEENDEEQQQQQSNDDRQQHDGRSTNEGTRTTATTQEHPQNVTQTIDDSTQQPGQRQS